MKRRTLLAAPIAALADVHAEDSRATCTHFFTGDFDMITLGGEMGKRNAIQWQVVSQFPGGVVVRSVVAS